MKREEVLRSPEYWTAKTQVELYNCAKKFMDSAGLNRAELAEHLGVSKGYVSQVLNGDYDHRMSKFFELALSFGFVPQIEFVPVEQCIASDKQVRTFKLNVSDIPSISNWSKTIDAKSLSVNLDSPTCTEWKSPKEVA